MNINGCDLNTRNYIQCNFNIDCVNEPKVNQIQNPCPARVNQEILKCSIDNRSQVCPVLMCNHQKHLKENEDIYKRNFPEEKLCVIPDYRGSYKVCDKYRSLEIDTKCNNTKASMNPGKGTGLGFLGNIDIDSELRIKNRNTLCPGRKYNRQPCDTQYVDNPTILPNPSCENNKYYSYPPERQSYKTKCNQSLNSFDIQFNIDPKSNTCIYNDIKKTNPQIKSKQPILDHYQSILPRVSRFEVGPERFNHSLENVWNNVTKRNNIH